MRMAIQGSLQPGERMVYRTADTDRWSKARGNGLNLSNGRPGKLWEKLFRATMGRKDARGQLASQTVQLFRFSYAAFRLTPSFEFCLSHEATPGPTMCLMPCSPRLYLLPTTQWTVCSLKFSYSLRSQPAQPRLTSTLHPCHPAVNDTKLCSVCKRDSSA